MQSFSRKSSCTSWAEAQQGGMSCQDKRNHSPCQYIFTVCRWWVFWNPILTAVLL